MLNEVVSCPRLFYLECWRSELLPSGPKQRREGVARGRIETRGLQPFDGPLHWVGGPLQAGRTVLDDRVGSAWVPVLGLTQAAGVHDLQRTELEMKRHVRVAYENEIGLEAGDCLAPPVGIGTEIAVERLGRGCVQEKNALAVESDRARARETSEAFAGLRSVADDVPEA
jgi:hypothetical protein